MPMLAVGPSTDYLTLGMERKNFAVTAIRSVHTLSSGWWGLDVRCAVMGGRRNDHPVTYFSLIILTISVVGHWSSVSLVLGDGSVILGPSLAVKGP